MKRILYLGTDPANFCSEGEVVHYPVIKIVPQPVSADVFKEPYTHLIFTSKYAVSCFFNAGGELKREWLIAVGRVTAAHLSQKGHPPHHIAQEETQEGVIALLQTLDLKDAYLFLPRSSLSRPALTHFLEEQKVRYRATTFYETHPQKLQPVPDLALFDEIVFTSPSTVSAFLKIYQHFPKDKKLTPIGPITEQILQNKQREV